MKMDKKTEDATLQLAEILISECHKYTQNAAVAIAALRVSLETVISSAQVSEVVLPEACSVPVVESQADLPR